MGANWKCNGSTAFVKDIINNLINSFAYDKSKLGKVVKRVTGVDLMVMPTILHISLV